MTGPVAEALAWLGAAVIACVTFAVAALAVLRLLVGRPAAGQAVTARADVVEAVTSRALADKRVRAAGLAAKDASSAALTPLPVEDGATYVHVGPRTAWVCPRRWPDGLDVTAIDTAIHRSVALDAHIVYVVRDATTDGAWPAALAAMVRRHQLLCPLPPRQRGPID